LSSLYASVMGDYLVLRQFQIDGYLLKFRNLIEVIIPQSLSGLFQGMATLTSAKGFLLYSMRFLHCRDAAIIFWHSVN